MSNLLKSTPVDTTPVGNRPTTIIQNIIEITADKTGEELCHLLAHKNSVFTYNGIPVTYVKNNNGVFEFNVWDVSTGTPKLKSYSVNGKTITAGADIPIDSELPSVSSTDNGDVLTVVEGEWAKASPSASPVAVVEFTMGESGATSVLTASEIYALANGGKYLVGRVPVQEGFIMQVQIGQISLGDVYTMIVSVVTSEAETPICITATASTGTDHFVISLS